MSKTIKEKLAVMEHAEKDAVIAKKNEALGNMVSSYRLFMNGNSYKMPQALQHAEEALSTPNDDSALQEIIKQVNDVWYSALGKNYTDFDPTDAITAFGAQVRLEAMCEMAQYHEEASGAVLQERERCAESSVTHNVRANRSTTA